MVLPHSECAEKKIAWLREQRSYSKISRRKTAHESWINLLLALQRATSVSPNAWSAHFFWRSFFRHTKHSRLFAGFFLFVYSRVYHSATVCMRPTRPAQKSDKPVNKYTYCKWTGRPLAIAPYMWIYFRFCCFLLSPTFTLPACFLMIFCAKWISIFGIVTVLNGFSP